jgi:hypothetical protein
MARRSLRDFNRAMQQSAVDATNAIAVGGVYFLSHHHDIEGCMVRVDSKSTKKNGLGWASSVVVTVVDHTVGVPTGNDDYYTIGSAHTVHAGNLYTNRKLASWEAKRAS